MLVGKIKKHAHERRHNYQVYFTAVYGNTFTVINSKMTVLPSAARPNFETIYIQAYYFKTNNKHKEFRRPI